MIDIMPKPFPPRDPILILRIIKGVVNTVKKVWNVITGKDEKQEEIARQKSFNPEKSDANEIAELNKLLSEYRANITSAADNLEREMIVEYSMQMQEIMDLFEEYNKTFKIMRSETVKRRFRRMGNDIKGTFSEYIGRKISLDNSECVSVLKLGNADLKTKRLQEMKEKVFIEATNEIVRKIKDNVDDFSETVEDAFYEHLDRSELSLAEKSSAFDEFSKISEENAQSVESVLLSADYIVALCSFGEELL